MTEFAITAPVAKPLAWSISASVTWPESSVSRSCTARCLPGRSEVKSEATDGFVHDAWAMACSKTTASLANFASSGVVSRA